MMTGALGFHASLGLGGHTVTAPSISTHFGSPVSAADISAVTYAGFQGTDTPRVLAGALACVLTDSGGNTVTPSSHLPPGR